MFYAHELPGVGLNVSKNAIGPIINNKTPLRAADNKKEMFNLVCFIIGSSTVTLANIRQTLSEHWGRSSEYWKRRLPLRTRGCNKVVYPVGCFSNLNVGPIVSKIYSRESNQERS